MRLLFLVFLLLPTLAVAHSGRTNSEGCHNDRIHGGYHCHSGKSSHANTTPATPSYSQPAKTVNRDSDGRIHRSAKAKADFKKLHPCPSTGRTKGSCSGYVIDHITPLACGGADDPSNMQWQSEAEGHAKDKWERDGCEIRH
jgi:5-methylcytosine-specific restriction endonuclease McrA